MAQCLGKTVETGESSVYGGRLAAKEPKWCHQGDWSRSLDHQQKMTTVFTKVITISSVNVVMMMAIIMTMMILIVFSCDSDLRSTVCASWDSRGMSSTCADTRCLEWSLTPWHDWTFLKCTSQHQKYTLNTLKCYTFRQQIYVEM